MKELENGRKIISATVRDAEDEWHIECRFENGEKYAAIHVDIDREDLADWLCALINKPKKLPRRGGWKDEK